MDYCSINACWTIIALPAEIFGHYISGFTKVTVITVVINFYDSSVKRAITGSQQT